MNCRLTFRIASPQATVLEQIPKHRFHGALTYMPPPLALLALPSAQVRRITDPCYKFSLKVKRVATRCSAMGGSERSTQPHPSLVTQRTGQPEHADDLAA